MPDPGALEIILGELTDALAPIVTAANEDPKPAGLIRLAMEVGVDLSAMTQAQGTAFATSVGGIYSDLTSLIEDPDGFAAHIPEALEHVRSLTDAMAGLDLILPAPADIARKLFD